MSEIYIDTRVDPAKTRVADMELELETANKVIAHLQARVREMNEDRDHALKEAKRRMPDYPWSQNTASEVVWALGEGYLGVSAAIGSWKDQSDKLKAAIKRLCAAGKHTEWHYDTTGEPQSEFHYAVEEALELIGERTAERLPIEKHLVRHHGETVSAVMSEDYDKLVEAVRNLVDTGNRMETLLSSNGLHLDAKANWHQEKEIAIALIGDGGEE